MHQGPRDPARASLFSLLLAVATGCPPGDETPTTGPVSAESGDTSADPTGTVPTSSSSSTETGSTGTTGTTGADSGETTEGISSTVDSTGATTSDATTGTTADGSGTSTSSGETGSSSSSEEGSTTEEATETDGCGLAPAAEVTAMELAAAVDGVTYPSESDYPWIVVTFACAAPVTADNVKAIIAPVYVQNPDETALADRLVVVRTMAQLFDPLTVPKDWWEPEHHAQAEKYAAIRAVLEDNLTDLQVFRLSEPDEMGAVDVYVIGATADGDLVGMWTVSIET
jgi:hypothetical protein